MAANAISAADYVFPGIFDDHLEAVLALGDDGPKILQYVIDNKLEGIGSAVMQMEPEYLPGLEKLAGRFRSANGRLIEGVQDVPLERLGVTFQSACNFDDYPELLAINTPHITSQDLDQARTRAAKNVTGPAVVAVFAQPRRDRDGNIVSIHFSTMFWPENDPKRIRFVESYNYQKDEGYAPGWEKLVELWARHGIHITKQRKPTSLFERAFAPQETNTRFAIPDVTEHGDYETHRDLMGFNAFGISANRPGDIIYGTEAVVLSKADQDAHLDLETRYQVGEIARAKGTTTFEGLHTGDKSCLNQTAIAIARAVGDPKLARRPIDQVYEAFCKAAFETYTAKEPGLSLNLFFSARETNFVKQPNSDAVSKLIGDGFLTSSMSIARDETRSAYRTQYIDHVLPHTNDAFNKLGLRVMEVCAKLLERLVLYLRQVAAGQSDEELNAVFGIGQDADE